MEQRPRGKTKLSHIHVEEERGKIAREKTFFLRLISAWSLDAKDTKKTVELNESVYVYCFDATILTPFNHLLET